MRNGNNNVESSSFLFLCKFKSVWKEYKEKDLGHKLFFFLYKAGRSTSIAVPVYGAEGACNHYCTCGLVAMTSAQHAEGRQFDPGQVYALSHKKRSRVWAGK